MNKRKMICTAGWAGVLSLLACPAAGDEALLPAVDSGFVTEMGGTAKGDGTLSGATFNYSVGRELHYDDGSTSGALIYMERKNYFVFDLTGVTGLITEAKLTLYAGPSIGDPFPDGMHGYESVDPEEVFEVVATDGDPAGVLTLIEELADLNVDVKKGGDVTVFSDADGAGVTIGKELFGKLGDGGPINFAPAILSPATDDTFVMIDLDPGYLNGFLGGKVVLTGVLPSAIPPDPDPETVAQSAFGYTEPDLFTDPELIGTIIPGTPTPLLSVTFIPEPGSLVLLSLGGLIAARRRRGV